MDEIFTAFTEDAAELLTAMESGLLQLEEGSADAETLNSIFRAAHTIKGDAGVVDLPHIEQFAHVMENYLDLLRKNELAVSRPLITLLLRCCDHFRVLFVDIRAGHLQPGAEHLAAGDALGRALHQLVGGAPLPVVAIPEPAPTNNGVPPTLAECWHIVIHFGTEAFRNRTDPIDFLRHLATHGQIVALNCLLDRLPDASVMDAETCYLGFEVYLASGESKDTIERSFDFLQGQCALQVRAPESRVVSTIDTIEDLPEEAMRLGEILLHSNAVTRRDIDQGMASLRAATVALPEGAVPPHLGEILVAQELVQPEIVEAAANKQKQVAVHKSDEARQIRVRAEKLDQLIDLVGEMVVSSASACTMARGIGHSGLMETNAGLARLIEDMRELSLQLRMVQIGETFNRYRRVVRDMARDKDMEIDLVISGEETELDKNLIEKIGDPILHLVRNAIDHGIEPAATRLAGGKPANGRVTLNAYHETGGIVIEVSDDGAGLNRARILAKALQRGLVHEDQDLTDQEVFDLIFVPGFSTVDQVTNLSGRGVGMDVVRSNVAALRGTVDVRTAPGAGCCFVIHLPLTMAIIDGFQVEVGRATYVLPLDTVVECLALPPQSGDDDFISLRGHVLPCVRLRTVFAVGNMQSQSQPLRENVVVVRAGKAQVGIIVDHLSGECQAVIKPLAAMFRNLRGVAGSTILGTGDVALILDVPALIALAAESPASRSIPV